METSEKRLELSMARLEGSLASLATKADVATLTERSVEVAARLAALEEADRTTIASAIGKTIGIGGAITLFIGQISPSALQLPCYAPSTSSRT